MAKEKSYLGDSVYAEVDDCGYIRLTTENGFGPSNEIYLEQCVYEALVRYASTVFESKEKNTSAKKAIDEG